MVGKKWIITPTKANIYIYIPLKNACCKKTTQVSMEVIVASRFISPIYGMYPTYLLQG